MTTGSDINAAIKDFLKASNARSARSGLAQDVIVEGVQGLIDVDASLNDDAHLAILLLLAQYRTMPPSTGSVLCDTGLYYLNSRGGRDAVVRFPIEFARSVAPAFAPPMANVDTAAMESAPRSGRRTKSPQQAASRTIEAAEPDVIPPEPMLTEDSDSSMSIPEPNGCRQLIGHVIALQDAGVISETEFVQLIKNVAQKCQE